MLYDVEYRDRIFQVQVTFDLIDPGAMTAIYLDVPGFGQQMISDFPRCLLRRDSATCGLQLSSLVGSSIEEMLIMPLLIPSNTLNNHPLSGQLLEKHPTSVTDTQ